MNLPTQLICCQIQIQKATQGNLRFTIRQFDINFKVFFRSFPQNQQFHPTLELKSRVTPRNCHIDEETGKTRDIGTQGHRVTKLIGLKILKKFLIRFKNRLLTGPSPRNSRVYKQVPEAGGYATGDGGDRKDRGDVGGMGDTRDRETGTQDDRVTGRQLTKLNWLKFLKNETIR